ncbi:hypothetical protein Slin15195_G129430 [Septoria linicola]|uniref:Uncharacterized protein n=1 Tax=Septoria linicola TaxID=215465 RepID=A0A9Q9ER83_9PEZI|nr:hypothetical protein Slin15195_G129430 [Septoria linicola]
MKISLVGPQVSKCGGPEDESAIVSVRVVYSDGAETGIAWAEMRTVARVE